MKHKHAELIKAWADGAKIEKKEIYCRYQMNEEPIIVSEAWLPDPNPTWHWTTEYRVALESKLESHKKTMFIYNSNADGKSWVHTQPPDRTVLPTGWQYMGSIEVDV